MLTFVGLWAATTMVAVIEAPDDAAYAKVMLVLGSRGGVRTETLSASTEDEFRNIVAAVT